MPFLFFSLSSSHSLLFFSFVYLEREQRSIEQLAQVWEPSYQKEYPTLAYLLLSKKKREREKEGEGKQSSQ